jgi:hypothetical protein
MTYARRRGVRYDEASFPGSSMRSASRTIQFADVGLDLKSGGVGKVGVRSGKPTFQDSARSEVRKPRLNS